MILNFHFGAMQSNANIFKQKQLQNESVRAKHKLQSVQRRENIVALFFV